MMLSVKDLAMEYPGDKGKVAALEGVDLEIARGSFTCIVGPSGCGKTTLLKLLCGLVSPTQGSITLEGHTITGPSPHVGMVFQEYALFPWLKVVDNIAFGLEVRGVAKEERRRRAAEYARMVGLEGFEEAYPKELSGGMMQRAAIARTLITEPDIILMDEPFGSLDAQRRNILQDFLIDLWKRTGKTVVFVTHNVDEAVFLGERVILLSRRPGTIKADMDIDLPYPRDRTSTEFVGHRKDILELLKDELGENI